MAKGSCTCGLCSARQRPNGWLTERAERLRGYEIELDSEALAFNEAACKGHLHRCKTELQCTTLKRRAPAPGANVECDCEACTREAAPKSVATGWTCPGHSCLEMNKFNPSVFLAETMKAAVTRAGFPHKGNFGDYAHTARDNEYFEFKTDSSCGYEIATPPLDGKSVVPAIGPVTEALQKIERDHGINLSTPKCGLHCTFDIQDLGTRDWKQLVFTAYRHQEALVATQPRQRRNNEFCKFMPSLKHPRLTRRGARCGCGQCRIMRMTKEEARDAGPRGGGIGPFQDRRTFINMTNLSKGLVEFRFGGPTTDIREIDAYGVVLECLIDASITRPALCDSNNRKRRFYEEIIRPYLGDARVEAAWNVLKPRWEKAELARTERGGD